jgi:stage II sporulation SpoAA-like protein
MLTFLDTISSGNVVGVKVDGTLTHADYQRLIEKFEEVIREHGKVRVFMELEDCQGWEIGAWWEIGAFWDELTFALKHYGDFGRCAVIGERYWHQWMTNFSTPFFNVKYFAKPHFKEAWEWVTENVEAAVGTT